MNIKLPDVKNKKRLLPLLLIVAGLLVAFRNPIMGLISPVQLDLQIQHQPVIMPAVYKVYANDNALNGKYSLFKMLVTNNSSTTARNVDVSFQIPNYIDWTSCTKIPIMLPGQSVVVNCYPSFQDKIVEKTTTSKEKVNIKIKGSNVSEIDQDFDIEIRGRNEFMYTCIPAEEIRTAADMDDNMDLLSCYVTPEDPIIKYYTQKIQEKILKGEDASVANKPEEGVRFMKGIYYATLISHMVYSGTSGVPAKYDDVSSIMQSIRLPREVITGKTGLCIELSLAYASIMASAGMDPIIYLIPGHAYPGFKMNGQYYAIEATGIGGEGMQGGRASVEDAYNAGMKEAQDFFKAFNAGDDRYRIVDVRNAINKGAVAMELKDDQFLRQKIDEIAQGFDANYQVVNNQQQQNNMANNQGNDNGGNGGNNGYNLYQGTVTFSYPGNWRLLPRTAQTMPQIKHILANRANTAFVEVYQFDGYNNLQQAFSAIEQYVQRFGARIQYKTAGQTNSGYAVYTGQTFYNGGSINWMAEFKVTGNGVSGISAGANATTGTQYQSTVLNILNSLR